MVDPEVRDLWTPTGLLLGFQVTLFKWRLEREAAVGDKGDIPWLVPADYFSIFGMLSFADRLKIVTWDGSGLLLLWKWLEHGAFRWPPISDGVMRLTASQLAALVDGMDWSRLYARNVVRPTATS